MDGEHMASSKRGHRRGRERLMPLADDIQVVDDTTLFEQLSLLKNHGFTPEELRTMPPDVVAREYARAVREGATASAPPAEAAEPAKTGATASQEPGQAGAAALSGVWPQPTNPLLQIDGPVARLLKGLSQSPRNDDELRLTEVLGAIGFFVDSYGQSAHDHPPLWQKHLHAEQKELDKIYKKAVKLATDLRGSDVLRHNRPSWPEDDGLDALLAALDDFTAAKRKRLVGKRGPKTPRPSVEVIIQAIEEYTGTKLKRSNKWGPPPVVVRIIEIMDPAIGSGTIDEALKAQSRARREISRQKRGEIKRRKR